jgi:hypothetical protein
MVLRSGGQKMVFSPLVKSSLKFLQDKARYEAMDSALDRSPFDEDFPDCFRSNARNLNYLDTDMALAFTSQDNGAHPHFDRFCKEFAASDAVFINSFMAALDKMSKLGVRVTLLSPSSCGPVASPAALPPPAFTNGLRESIGEAREQLADTLEERDEEIEELITPGIFEQHLYILSSRPCLRSHKARLGAAFTLGLIDTRMHIQNSAVKKIIVMV